MKLHYLTVLTLFIMILSGCGENVLVQRLKIHRITQKNTTSLRFISSQGAFGADTTVTINDKKVIKSVWSCIKSAQPATQWAESGYHRIEFVASDKTDLPAATILLNAKDEVHIEGDLWKNPDPQYSEYYGLWTCAGLNEIVMKHMKAEYEHNQTGKKEDNL